MMTNDSFFVAPELAYRRQRNRRSIASHRGARTRTTWLRRLAAADQTTDRLAETAIDQD